MKRPINILLLFVIFIFTTASAYYFAGQAGLRGKSQIITITDNGFEPASITVDKNTRVVFKNIGNNDHWPASDLHPTHGIYSEFDPLDGIFPGKDWSFVFKKSGKWRYHDHLAPELRGEIIVNP